MIGGQLSTESLEHEVKNSELTHTRWATLPDETRSPGSEHETSPDRNTALSPHQATSYPRGKRPQREHRGHPHAQPSRKLSVLLGMVNRTAVEQEVPREGRRKTNDDQ